jgi:hypothetical protein
MRKRLFLSQLWIPVLLIGCSSLPNQRDQEPQAFILSEFSRTVPNYDLERTKRKKILKSLEKSVSVAEIKGEEISCASQISNEVSWMLGYTSDFSRIDKRLSDLQVELAKKSKQRSPDKQNNTDGTWGHCFEEWFFKLSLSGDHLLELTEKNQSPKYAPKFLERINSPEKLTAYLDSILITNIENERKVNRRELNESSSSLVRLIFKLPPSVFIFHPNLKQTLVSYINDRWRDQTTGYWGAWFRGPDENILKTSDVSMTFHLISYFKGKVTNQDKVFHTTLSIRNKSYPFGWLDDGQYENHHNYDVVRLLRYGWPYATFQEQEIAHDEIKKMMNWCLRESISSDGEFKQGNSDDSIEDAYYFGVSFLDEIGFFDVKKRFWTDETLPLSEEIKKRLTSRIRMAGSSGGKSGVYYRSALEKLEGR